MASNRVSTRVEVVEEVVAVLSLIGVEADSTRGTTITIATMAISFTVVEGAMALVVGSAVGGAGVAGTTLVTGTLLCSTTMEAVTLIRRIMVISIWVAGVRFMPTQTSRGPAPCLS